MGNCLHKEFLNHLPSGVMIVDEDVKLVEINRYALECMGVRAEEAIGLPFGEAFACSTLQEEKNGCGSTDNCQSCKLRDEVLSVLQDGKGPKKVMFSHEFIRNGTKEVKWFRVSVAHVNLGSDDTYALVALTDFSDEKEYEERLFREAITDMPMGAYNKHYSMDRLTNFVSQGSAFSVAMVDFDHFKYFNDTYGHQMGDKLLAEFVSMAKDVLRATDLCGRFGGEEFIILLPRTTLDDAIN